MTILYTDNLQNQRIECDALQAADVQAIVRAYMIFKSADFDLLHIDLRGDIEAATCFDLQSSRQVCSWGGAAAFGIYRDVAGIFPQINRHTSGRPAVIL